MEEEEKEEEFMNDIINSLLFAQLTLNAAFPLVARHAQAGRLCFVITNFKFEKKPTPHLNPTFPRMGNFADRIAKRKKMSS